MWFRVCFIVHLSISSYSSFIYAVAIVLIIVGQVLNLQVYQALGKTGVYYGNRFNKQVPWVQGWPFNYISNPQYIGVILTLIGGFVWLPSNFIISGIISYIYLIFVESRVPPTRRMPSSLKALQEALQNGRFQSVDDDLSKRN